jgi:hypothetical protein
MPDSHCHKIEELRLNVVFAIFSKIVRPVEYNPYLVQVLKGQDGWRGLKQGDGSAKFIFVAIPKPLL